MASNADLVKALLKAASDDTWRDDVDALLRDAADAVEAAEQERDEWKAAHQELVGMSVKQQMDLAEAEARIATLEKDLAFMDGQDKIACELADKLEQAEARAEAIRAEWEGALGTYPAGHAVPDAQTLAVLTREMRERAEVAESRIAPEERDQWREEVGRLRAALAECRSFAVCQTTGQRTLSGTTCGCDGCTIRREADAALRGPGKEG